MPIDRSPGTSSASASTSNVTASEIAALKRKRGIIKGSCTRIETFVNSVNAVDDDARAQLEVRRACLDPIREDYCKVQSQLEAIDEAEIEDRDAFEDKVYSLCARMQRLLRNDSGQNSPRASTPVSARSESEAATYVRLPKLNLPSFSGKYEEWFPFHDTFISVIHNNKTLSDIQKFQYLRASLTGTALDIVKTLEISNNNYDLAWNILKERYNNKRVIVQTHIKAIFELTAITKESASGIRQLADGAAAHVRALTALDCNADKWDALLIHIITSKLDHGGGIENSRAAGSAADGSTPIAGDPAVVVAHGAVGGDGAEPLLSTAVVYVYGADGSRMSCRALLDAGAQANFISNKFVAKLRLKTLPTELSISGLFGSMSVLNRMARVRFRSRLSSFEAELDCVVTDRIADRVPASTLRRQAFRLPPGIDLADPKFNISSDIDLLIGIDLFWRLACVGQIHATSKHPLLQKTRLGWVLAGRTGGGTSRSSAKLRALHATINNAQLHERVDQFWRIEELADSNGYTRDEQACESHFMTNVSTNDEGRYIVKLPLKEDIFQRLGESRETAIRRFLALEKRLNRDPGLKRSYANFLREYQSLGHIRIAPARSIEGKPVYLPHHGVIKGIGPCAKLRVVFDASCKTSTGVSLNEALRIGPVIQQELITILMRFRTFVYVFVADIIKMYRQILLHKSQTHLHRIVWREDSGAPIGEYELLTVTYGTSSASFLATRCLQHLAQKHADEFAIGSGCVLRDFYVDDLLTGANTLSEVRRVREETVALLKRGRFELGRWASNCRELLKDVEGATDASVSLGGDSSSKILGIAWDPVIDSFKFDYESGSPANCITKRTILSEIASLFDPLGLLGPLTVVAKLILQDTWQTQVGWDESLPQDIHTRWLGIKQQLTNLGELRVPRFVGRVIDAGGVQLHGFCDASERAYGACVYVRAYNSGECRVRLLVSKSRVAPMRAISLPRLELSAALLLAKLIEKVRESVGLPAAGVVLWSDSTITLQWIQSSSRKWSAFVANRVGEIQRLTEGADWRHVPSADNPADILSRGADLAALAVSGLWWEGPAYLRLNEGHWPIRNIEISGELPEQKRVIAAVAVGDRSIVSGLLERFSSLEKILRIISYCLRFGRARRAEEIGSLISHREMTAAMQVVVRCVQRGSFPGEYRSLGEGRSIDGGSRILSLSPFMDECGVIRVGGRISRAALPPDAVHPMLLPKSHALTTLIIRGEHVRSLHAGLQATICAVRQRYWPLAARSAVRRVLRECVACFRCRPAASQAVMADLPGPRVNVSRPFTHTGVDYAGPIFIKESKRRNARMLKAYIAVLVCFATKAVHLEVVSDLTADAFLGAFKRFMSRRGRPACVYSDNGTTFIGANRQIREIYEVISSPEGQENVRQFARRNEFVWKFIPPHAPHFGGLWKAAVKSAKLI
ncbi:uncharacterized protein LOC114941382 [Nylanderia fulva]|uniref:uncharacterized protein LOC114941382 n=1 Tax=Nylanderia fulva TaxID=613905 RepID=UPI0010FB979B|nr:uncharacterized protein LOC114941382 [Nylanderia fulva]